MINHIPHVPGQGLMKKKPMYTEYFDAVYNSWLSASVSMGGEVHRYLKINGFSIRLSFCGSGMIPDIMPAFEHVVSPEVSESDLTVCIWDSKTSGIKIPEIPGKINDLSISEAILKYNDDTLMIVYWLEIKTIMLLNKTRNLGIYWIQDASAIPFYDKVSPLRLIFQRWMRRRSCQVVHAGAVGFYDGGVLLVGKGGSGKSTTSLTCLNSELLYAGDDLCLITDYPDPYVYSLYNTGKLNAHDIDRFPSLKPALIDHRQLNGEKAIYFFYRCFHDKISAGFPVKAIFILEITGLMNTKIRRVSPAKGFLALAPTTVSLMPRGVQPDLYHHLASFVRRVPNYVLELGTDLNQIPRVIIDFLKSDKNE